MSNTMIILYLAMIISNIIINAYFYFGSRNHQVYKWGMTYWVAGLVHAICHSETLPTVFHILGIMLVALTNYSVLKSCSYMLKIDPNDKFYRNLTIFGFAASSLLIPFMSYEKYIFGFVIVCIIPYIHYVFSNIKTIWTKTNKLEKVMILTYAVNVLHLINYPLMLGNRELLFIGFNIAFGFASVFSLFLYLIADSIFIKEIEAKLKEEISKSQRLMKSAIYSDIIMSFSHEINNAMQSLQLNQEILSIKSKKEQNEQLGKVSLSMKNSVEKINDILAPFYDQNKELASIELPYLIKESFSFIDPIAKENKSAIVLENQPNEISISTSKGLFSQLIVQIIKSLSKNNKKVSIEFKEKSILFKAEEFCSNFDSAFVIADQLKLELTQKEKSLELNLSSKIKEIKKSA